MYTSFLIIAAVLLASALGAGVFAVTVCRQRAKAGAAASIAPAPPPKIVYRDTPTVRLTNPQRVDRLRKIVQLRVGEHVDLLEDVAPLPARFRLTLKRLVCGEQGHGVHIAVDFGGAVLSGGASVEEFALNEFIVPRAQRDESRCCVFHLQERGDSMEFMRIKVRNIDASAGWAELDVLQVSGHWPS